MSNEAVVLKEANLDILEDNLDALATNLSTLSSNMNNVDNKVNAVTNSVKTIEEEIKTFMYEIRQSTIVSNAKQSLLVAENKLEKNMAIIMTLEEKINGLLESTDLNAIKKSTIESMSEETLLNTPEYYLAPALVALSAWFTDNKELAYRALDEVMKRDDEKTSLLFCLIHLRANRKKTSLNWLKRYLNLQDPTNMDSNIIIILDAISSGILDISAKELVLSKIKEWMNILKTNKKYKETQIQRWNNIFNDLTIENKDLLFPYIEKYTSNIKEVQNTYNFAKSRKNIYNYLNNITTNTLDKENTNKIDKIIKMLIFNYENEELELKKEIERNNIIIKENGNLKVSEEKFKDTSLAFQEKTDFYTILTNIITEDAIETLTETKKLALSLSKDFIIEAYNNHNKERLNNNNNNIEITINNCTLYTTDGKNERELIKTLTDNITNKNKIYIESEKYINFKMIVAVFICALLSFLVKDYPIFIFLFISLTIAFLAFQIFNIYTRKNAKINKMKEEINKNKEILLNIIAEIVDLNYTYKETESFSKKIANFLNEQNYENYITADNQRNIIIDNNGGYNE